MLDQGFRFFSRLVGRSDPWSKKWWVILWYDGPKHIKLNTVDIWVVYFTYTLTQTLVRISWLYSKTCLKRPFKKVDQLLLYAGRKYCRMHSAILWPSLSYHLLLRSLFCLFLSGCLRQVLLYWQPTCSFCFVEFIDSLWDEYFFYWSEIFSQLKKMGPILKSWDMTRAHHKSEGLWIATHFLM